VAALLRLPKRGRIAVGNHADLLLLDADHRVSDVMIAGHWHVRHGRQQVFGRFEQPAT
jgi:beta-aspartyl-dipeptidase (metallo-type)